jgi:serine/threonine protein kinase
MKYANLKPPRAIKIIEKKKVNEHPIYKQLLKNELKILRECRHPNIMDVQDIIEDENNFYIISELIVGGSIFERLKKKKRFNEKESAIIIK